MNFVYRSVFLEVRSMFADFIYYFSPIMKSTNMSVSQKACSYKSNVNVVNVTGCLITIIQWEGSIKWWQNLFNNFIVSAIKRGCVSLIIFKLRSTVNTFLIKFFARNQATRVDLGSNHGISLSTVWHNNRCESVFQFYVSCATRSHKLVFITSILFP